MTFLSTGPIEYNAVSGARTTQSVTLRIDNRSDSEASTVSIQGHYMSGVVRNLYVSQSTGVTGATGETGATGTTGVTGATGQNVAAEGFSSLLPTFSASASTQLTGWTVTSSYCDSASFNETTGNYTVPVTGRYSFEATINYSTTAAITVALGAGINPAFFIRRTSPATTDLVTGLFPLLNVNIALLLTLRTILGNGTVTLTGEFDLTAGDVVCLFYEADGLTVPLDLGGTSSGVIWSVHRFI